MAPDEDETWQPYTGIKVYIQKREKKRMERKFIHINGLLLSISHIYYS